MIKLKEQLREACRDFMEKQFNEVNKTLQDLRIGLEQEEKSSAGDKHETGRAKLQLEMEKASQKMNDLLEMREVMKRVSHEMDKKVAHLGSLVRTPEAHYYLAISAGKIVLDKTTYFAISTKSPIGKAILGAKVGDRIQFNGQIISDII